MINEKKLRSDWEQIAGDEVFPFGITECTVFLKGPYNMVFRDYVYPESIAELDYKKVADYWIEKIKQSNLALLEEVEGEIKDYSTYWRHPMAVFPKPRTPQSELIEMKSKEDILSTLSKHKERLTK